MIFPLWWGLQTTMSVTMYSEKKNLKEDVKVKEGWIYSQIRVSENFHKSSLLRNRNFLLCYQDMLYTAILLFHLYFIHFSLWMCEKTYGDLKNKIKIHWSPILACFLWTFQILFCFFFPPSVKLCWTVMCFAEMRLYYMYWQKG